MSGKENLERSASLHLRLDMNAAADVAHDPVHDRKPETMAGGFRCEERIKDPGSGFRIDSATAVGHRKLDVADGPALRPRARHAARSHRDNSSMFPDCVRGVVDEIDNELP